MSDLGLVMVWADSDDTLVEPRAPYPHAREVAMLRAHQARCAALIGGYSRTAEAHALVRSGWDTWTISDPPAPMPTIWLRSNAPLNGVRSPNVVSAVGRPSAPEATLYGAPSNVVGALTEL